MTTKETIAAALNGIEYPQPFPPQIVADAKAAGLLIIYGASDDLMEFDGAFRDEIGCYDGGFALLDRKGLVQRGEDADDEAIADHVIRKRTASKVEALWAKEGDYSWTYATDIPHATFEVVEDGGPYCRGIVIDTADLPEAPQLPGSAS